MAAPSSTSSTAPQIWLAAAGRRKVVDLEEMIRLVARRSGRGVIAWIDEQDWALGRGAAWGRRAGERQRPGRDRLRRPCQRAGHRGAGPPSRRLLAGHGRGARHRGFREPELSAAGAAQLPPGLAHRRGPPGRGPGDAARPGPGPLADPDRDPELPLRRPADHGRAHGGRLRRRGQRLAGAGMAGPRAAATGLDRRHAPEPGPRRGGDRAPGGRPALRPGAGAGDRRDAARAAAPTGRSTRPPSATACRSASMPAAAIATRSPRSAGRPTTSRIMSRRRRASRRSSRA